MTSLATRSCVRLAERAILLRLRTSWNSASELRAKAARRHGAASHSSLRSRYCPSSRTRLRKLSQMPKKHLDRVQTRTLFSSRKATKTTSPSGLTTMERSRETLENRQARMRRVTMPALFCFLVAADDRASAQPSPGESVRPAESEKREHDAAVASCVKMWDAATHMTKPQWLRTCRRVQDRLRRLSQP
jgi:hypothetical protein